MFYFNNESAINPQLILLILIIINILVSIKNSNCQIWYRTPQANSNPICMTRLESSLCHSSGTNLSLIIQAHTDSICSNITQSNNTINKSRFSSDVLNNNSKSDLKQCPCKQNYAGLKCDTCSDQLYMKYIYNHHSTGNVSRTTHQKVNISNTYNETHRLKLRSSIRPFECINCDCNDVGSKSDLCDKRNGSCLCNEGYEGRKCDKCSYGYYDSTNTTSTVFKKEVKINIYGRGDNNLHPSLINMFGNTKPRCEACGECFNQWQMILSDLKQSSQELITRSYGVQQSFIGSSDSKYANDTQNIFKKAGLENYDELDNKLNIISDKVMANKQNSDRLILLANELNSTIKFFNIKKKELIQYKESIQQVKFNLTKLNYELKTQVDIVDEFGKLVEERFHQEQISIQENVPRGAFKLIQTYFNTSQIVSQNTLAAYRNQSQQEILDISKKLEIQINELKRKKLFLNDTVKILLDQHILGKNISFRDNDNSFNIKLRKLFSIEKNSSFFNIKKVESLIYDEMEKSQVAELLVQDTKSKIDLYVQNSPLRQDDLLNIIDQLSMKENIIDEIVQKSVNKFYHNITSFFDQIQNKICQQQQLKKRQQQQTTLKTNSCDFAQVIENQTEIVQISLDKLDAKWTIAKNQMFDLMKQSMTNDIKKQLTNLSVEINKKLETNLPILLNFADKIKVEVEDSLLLKNKTKALSMDINKLNYDLIDTFKIKSDTLKTYELTKILHQETKSNINKTFELLLSIESEFQQKNSTINTLYFNNLDLKQLEDKYKNTQSQSVHRRLNTKKMIHDYSIQLDNLNQIDKNYIKELKDKHQQLLTCWFSIVDDNDGRNKNNKQFPSNNSNGFNILTGDTEFSTNNTILSDTLKEKTKVLTDHKRVSAVISNYQFLSRQFYRYLSETEGLNEEFLENEKTFKRQAEILKLLNEEMDDINNDIEKKVKQYENNYSDCY